MARLAGETHDATGAVVGVSGADSSEVVDCVVLGIIEGERGAEEVLRLITRRTGLVASFWGELETEVVATALSGCSCSAEESVAGNADRFRAVGVSPSNIM